MYLHESLNRGECIVAGSHHPAANYKMAKSVARITKVNTFETQMEEERLARMDSHTFHISVCFLCTLSPERDSTSAVW